MTDQATIGDRIKAARLKMDITQEELARRAGVSQSTIGNLEANTRHKPRELLQIADALGVSAYWLERGDSESRPPSTKHDATHAVDQFAIATMKNLTIALPHAYAIDCEKELRAVADAVTALHHAADKVHVLLFADCGEKQ
jgi:transcriptional regulator with XRE-family HTH domain